MFADPTEAEVADAALRLMRLLDRPASLPGRLFGLSPVADGKAAARVLASA